MSSSHSVDILFLTNFSDYCFRSTPAIAQMADALRVRLTMMYVYDPECLTQDEASARLRNFFPEADRYRACHRIAARGPVVAAVRRHMEVWPVNLIVAPASDPIGFPRFGERSLRAQLIEQCGVPVWTFGRNMDLSGLSRPVRNVACWLDFRPQKTTHLSFAIEYAHKLNAKLHLLRALPPIQEGSLHAALHKEIPPQQEGMAHDQVLRLCAGAPVSPEIHIAEGAGRGTFRRLLSGCDADVVFLRNEEMILTRWLGLGLPFGDNSPCPAVYVGDRLSVPVWNFERGPAARKDEVLHEGVSVPSRVAAVRNVRRVSTVLSDLGLL